MTFLKIWKILFLGLSYMTKKYCAAGEIFEISVSKSVFPYRKSLSFASETIKIAPETSRQLTKHLSSRFSN